jgi:hypothetical protein
MRRRAARHHSETWRFRLDPAKHRLRNRKRIEADQGEERTTELVEAGGRRDCAYGRTPQSGANRCGRLDA